MDGWMHMAGNRFWNWGYSILLFVKAQEALRGRAMDVECWPPSLPKTTKLPQSYNPVFFQKPKSSRPPSLGVPTSLEVSNIDHPFLTK